MARGFGSISGVANTDRVITSANVGDPVQASFFCWALRNNVGADQIIFSEIGTKALYIYHDVSGGDWYTFLQMGWATFGQWKVPSPSTGVWHAVGVSYDRNSTSNNPVIYLDKTKPAPGRTSTPNGAYTSINAVGNIGNRTDTNVGSWNGLLAHMAIWDVILTDNEFYAMASGVLPINIRPLSLKGYWPLDGLQSPEPDLSGIGLNGTLTGTVGVRGGPPVDMFTPRWPRNYDPPPATVPLAQTHFRFRTDTNAVDATPTWGDAEDAA